MATKEIVKKVAKKTVEKSTKAVSDTTQTAMGDSGKSLFFLIVSMVCFWLILDMFYGKKKISQLVDIIFGDAEPETGTAANSSGSSEKEKSEGKLTEEYKNNDTSITDRITSGRKEQDKIVEDTKDKILSTI